LTWKNRKSIIREKDNRGEVALVMEAAFYRDSWVEIQLDAIKYNLQEIKSRINKDKQIFVVLKANAYGHGDIQVAKAALDEGVYGIAVALLDEGLRLRHAGITAPILVLGYVKPELSEIAADHDITLTVYQKEWLEKAKAALKNKKLSIHIKVDTGMGRIGIKSKVELEELLSNIDHQFFQVDGLFTHYATADEEDSTYYEQQTNTFKEAVLLFKQYITNPVIIHAENSAASIRFSDDSFNAIRYGISLYGLYPSPYMKKQLPISLRPVLSLHSRLVHVKKIEKGEYVSYGRTFQAKEETWVGTVPIGYADGWPRKLQGTEVLVEGKRMPIIGRICMDQFMIQLDKEYPVGTLVTLIGKQQEEEVSIDEVADHLNTINYEVACMISARLPRVYKLGEKVVEIENSVLK
jgi:alanine racemase